MTSLSTNSWPLRRTFLLFLLTVWNLVLFPALVLLEILAKCGSKAWLGPFRLALPWIPAGILLVWLLIRSFRLGWRGWILLSLLVVSSLPISSSTGGGLVVCAFATALSGGNAGLLHAREKNIERVAASMGLALGGLLALMLFFPFPLLHTGTLVAAEFLQKAVCR